MARPLRIDLKDGWYHVINRGPERAALPLAGWLEGHPGIEVVVRDRSSEYARSATLGAPEAAQVADRWHLLYNLRQRLGRWLAGIQGRLEQLPALAGEASPGQRTQAYPRTRAEGAAAAESRARWLARYEEGVRQRFQAGEKLLAISRAMGLARSTVRRYAYAGRFPERARRLPPPSILDPYLGHLHRFTSWLSWFLPRRGTRK